MVLLETLHATSLQYPLHHCNLLFRQPVQFIHQSVNLPVGGIDLTLDESFIVTGFRVRKLLVKGKHLLDKLHHAVVTGFVGGVGEVDGADGKALAVLDKFITEFSTWLMLNDQR